MASIIKGSHLKHLGLYNPLRQYKRLPLRSKRATYSVTCVAWTMTVIQSNNTFFPYLEILQGSGSNLNLASSHSNLTKHRLHQEKSQSLLSTSNFLVISPAKFGCLGAFYFCEVTTRLLKVYFCALSVASCCLSVLSTLWKWSSYLLMLGFASGWASNWGEVRWGSGSPDSPWTEPEPNIGNISLTWGVRAWESYRW